MRTESLHHRIFRLLTWNSFFRKFIFPPYYTYIVRGSVATIALRNGLGAFDSFGANDPFIVKEGSNLLDNGPRGKTISNGQAAEVIALNLEKNFASISTTHGTLLKIMPLGDSITAGVVGTHDKKSGGYRPELWNRLTASGLNVDFVGSMAGEASSLGSHRHEGHQGWKIQNIAKHISGWLDTYEPDIILLMIGTNDTKHSLKTIITQLSDLINQITTQLPHTQLLLASVPPIHPARKPIIRCLRAMYFNAAIPSIVNSKVAQGKKVHFVDMRSLTINDLTSSLGLNLDNGLHPNSQGYSKIAKFWYDAILEVLPQKVGLIGHSSQLLRTGKYDA